MDLALTVFLLLLLVGVSGVIVRFLPWLPLPLVQVGMGALAASPAIGLRVSFDPDLFMLLFVPPLLFADGWRVPKREFFQLGGPILTLALGLVIFTVVGAGYFVHWVMPAIPLSAALPWPQCSRPPTLWRCRRFPDGSGYRRGSCTSWKARRS
jgi:monovalent cation/hydrogen antiporter